MNVSGITPIKVAQNQKIGKPNNLIVLGAQNIWVLMLCRSFFYTGPAGSRATSIQLILLRRSRPIPRKHTPGRTDMGKKYSDD
jgi:hypothetical protein